VIVSGGGEWRGRESGVMREAMYVCILHIVYRGVCADEILLITDVNANVVN
jgi:hypothetical protein